MDNPDFTDIYHVEHMYACPSDIGLPCKRRRLIWIIVRKAIRVVLHPLVRWQEACKRCVLTT